MDYLLKNIIDRLEEYYKKTNVDLSEMKRNTSIVEQKPVLGKDVVQGKRDCC